MLKDLTRDEIRNLEEIEKLAVEYIAETKELLEHMKATYNDKKENEFYAGVWHNNFFYDIVHNFWTSKEKEVTKIYIELNDAFEELSLKHG